MQSLDTLFGLQEPTERTQITKIPILKLQPFENQPFKLYPDKQLEELAQDIRRNGLISPIVVRPLDTGMYQILAGHNRVNACLLNQENVIDAIVRHVNDDEAKLILVQSNLQQRQHLLNSEKAAAYKMRNDALKKMGQHASGHRSLETLAQDEKESSRTIARYIRTTKLIPDLSERFDQNEFSLPIAEALAGLSVKNQRVVDEYLERAIKKPTAAKLQQVIELAKTEPLTIEAIQALPTKEVSRMTRATLLREMEALMGQGKVDDDTFNCCLDLLKRHQLLKQPL
ncbi:MAG: ParB/RepB/Spo0J family partition protein [Aerococcaceae bacterium]|nr:ParB/RepB/Spo0J family partition protein [Aerococcaceae bacterium]